MDHCLAEHQDSSFGVACGKRSLRHNVVLEACWWRSHSATYWANQSWKGVLYGNCPFNHFWEAGQLIGLERNMLQKLDTWLLPHEIWWFPEGFFIEHPKFMIPVMGMRVVMRDISWNRVALNEKRSLTNNHYNIFFARVVLMASCRFLASKQPQITSRCKQDWCYTLTGASRAWNWRGPTNSFVRWFSFWKWSLFGFHRKISSVSIPNSSTPTFHWKWNSIFGDSILTSYLFHTYIYIYPIFSGSNPNNVSIF